MQSITNIKKTPLSITERVFCTCLVFVFLILASTVHQIASQSRVAPQEFEVRVVGAVEQEERIRLPRGATVGDLIAKIHLSSDAAIETLSLNNVCSNNLFIIPKRGVVTIYLTGIFEGIYYFPEGATMGDLYAKVKRKAKYRTKRKLKDCEVIAFE